MHDTYAKLLNADFVVVDFILPWHESSKSLKIRRYMSWILCALFFPDKKKYSVFFTEAIREPILIMKYLGLISNKQKIIPLMANETLYFYHNNRYSKMVKWLIKKYLDKSDAILCVGNFQSELAKKIVGDKQSAKVKTITNWIPHEKNVSFMNNVPILNSNKILFIGDVSSDFRVWYKGVDLMINAFVIAASINRSIELELIGINDNKLLEKYLLNIPDDVRNRIHIRPKQPILTFLETASLYLHCARGEAWGMTIMESLVAGVPVICSNLTGAMEVVEKVSEELIVINDENIIAEKIIWYFDLPIDKKIQLSLKGRNVMLDYSEEKSLKKFIDTFEKIKSEL